MVEEEAETKAAEEEAAEETNFKKKRLDRIN